MKDNLFTLFLICCFALSTAKFGYNRGWHAGWDEARDAQEPLNVEPEPVKKAEPTKTLSQAWEATKLFVAASIKSGHTASFQGQRAESVMERLGDGSFIARAFVYSRDEDGAITRKDFVCKIRPLPDGKWHGEAEITMPPKEQPKPNGEVI